MPRRPTVPILLAKILVSRTAGVMVIAVPDRVCADFARHNLVSLELPPAFFGEREAASSKLAKASNWRG